MAKNEKVDVGALYDEVIAQESAGTTGFVEVLLGSIPDDVAQQARALLRDGETRSNRNVAATLERLRVMFDVEVAPDKPGKKITTDHVQRWRSTRGIKY